MSRSAKLGDVEVPSDALQSVIAESGGIVSFSGAILPGDSIDWMARVQGMKESTQRLQWWDGQRGRTDIVYVEGFDVEEHEGPDGTSIKRFRCRTRVVG